MVEFFGQEILEMDKFQDLIRSYATSYWAGSWKELLKRTDKPVQFGTYDNDGRIYQETKKILEFNGVDYSNPNWPYMLWSMAAMGMLQDIDGQELVPYWTSESAGEELSKFVLPREEGGYGGEIAIVSNVSGECSGFAAYSVGDVFQADKRFPYKELVLTSGDMVGMSLSEVLMDIYGENRYGVFLDFAVAENTRGKGIGSKLFDLRLDRLNMLGAKVIVGRTIKTSPSQYFGNYLKRGMEIVAFDPANTDKALFAVETSRIIERKDK